MALGSIFKTQKHKRFEYKPVYFDPDKEDLNKRIKRAENEALNENSSTYVPDIKGKMKEYLITQNKAKATHVTIRRIIIVITILLMIAIFYYMVEITEFILSLPGN